MFDKSVRNPFAIELLWQGDATKTRRSVSDLGRILYASYPRDIAFVLYLFPAMQAYPEDHGKKARAKQTCPKQAPLAKLELFDMALKAKERYGPEDLKSIYERLNDKKE